ncbi:CHAT domain-containing protein [Pollutibacter soli]|uniref:CHAT domain-containing protein n=1 Tax=Pollutibacter soli TaxID=3034157 RepID=UPI0030139FFC
MPRKISVGDTFKISGTKIETPVLFPDSKMDGGFEVQEVYSLSVTRGEGDEIIINLQENQLVEFIFEDNTTWFGDKTIIADLLDEGSVKRSATEIPYLPAFITNENQTRGLFDKIKILFLKIFVKKAVKESVATIAARLEEKFLAGRSGLYRLTRNFDFMEPRFFPGKPILVLIHGTAASTEDSFKHLKDSDLWFEIFEKFAFEIYCFEHKTLIDGPLDNALELMQLLPENSTVSFLTTSRGGYVGELMVRFTENENGFTDDEVAIFTKAGLHEEVTKILTLRTLAKQKSIKIDRFVRIACAAQGTSLLTKRLDFFLNTLINLISLASAALGPVITTIVGLIKSMIAAVLEQKSNVDVLPGLAIQSPDSIFIKVLNSPQIISGKPVGFNNKLIVIAGSAKFSFNLRGLAVLLLKFVYGGAKNDMMVNTESMYQGSIRNSKVLYFFDEGNDVSHFSYFKNKTTKEAIKCALTATGDSIPGFQERELRLGVEEKRGVAGIQSGRLFPQKISGKKPVIILLPGIMGSVLETKEDFIWLNPWQILSGGLQHLAITEKDVSATALIRSAYADLFEYLSVKYDVLLFPYDWRLSVTDAAAKLNDVINELFSTKQQIQIIAHSMGGLVVRELMIHHTATWKMLCGMTLFRCILMGTPWMGSYRIPQLAAGRDQVIRIIDVIDSSQRRGDLINMFIRYPGLMNLLPLKGEINYSDTDEWADLKKYSGYDWEIPANHEIDLFDRYKKSAIDADSEFDYSRIVYIAGKADKTVAGYVVINDELKFENTSEGDESVTWELGIPDKIKNDGSLYYVNVSHGKLAGRSHLFPGLTDILEKGFTEKAEFSKNPIGETGKRSISDISLIEYDTSPDQMETAILGLDENKADILPPSPILKVSVSYGDLMYSAYPILIGHFAKDGILNAENVANKYLGNALAEKHALGIYPGLIGTSDFFESESKDIFNGCIVVGLGQMEELSAYQLMVTIEKAVSNYLLTDGIKKFKKNKTDKKLRSAKIGLSSLIIAGYYGGLSMEHSTRAILQGIVNANTKAMKTTGIADLYVDHLEFIELFEDKAIQCYGSLDRLIKGNSDNLNLVWNTPRTKQLPGARRRLIDDGTSSWWQRLSVQHKGDNVLNFYSATNTSREESQEIYNNIALIEEMIESISVKDRWSHDSAKAIFNLLIPTNFKENINRNSNVLWVLDNYSAAFPWELLQTGGDYDKPLCIGAGMIRQLSISEYKQVTASTRTKNVLIVGDPDLAGFTKARQLDGAKREAEKVASCLQKFAVDMEPPLIRSDHNEIIRSLFRKDYMIVHLSGHGIFDPTDWKRTGMLIGKKKDANEPMILSSGEIEKLPTPPEFVFVNCCHLGRVHPFAEELSAGRNKLAANIGTELIRIGVKAVIVAGWEVDDLAAEEFATRFYESMLDGNQSFGDAVLNARKYVHEKYRYTNTWGAFQCYGDPHYKFPIDIKGGASLKSKSPRLIQQLENDLDRILSCCDITYYKHDNLLDQLAELEEEMEQLGDVAEILLERLGNAYMELGHYDKALEKFDRLFKKGNAKYGIGAREFYYDLESRKILTDFLAVQNNKGIEIKKPAKKSAKSSAGKNEKSDPITALEQLNSFTQSISGSLYLGHMYRRSALMHKDQLRLKQLQKSIEQYLKAWELSSYKDNEALLNLAIVKFISARIMGRKWIGFRQGNTIVSEKQFLKTLTDIFEQSDFESSDLRNLTEEPTYKLLQLIHKNGKADETEIIDKYYRAWTKAGSRNKRKAIQEFGIILEQLVPDGKNTSLLATKLKAIREGLERYEDLV